ncbi:MAG: hypothetical protein J7483_10785 [Novosphingobium sp.]|nr:hypothetical protein [Novosphingobium sp.]
MSNAAIRAPFRYDTTLDRVGLALGVGSAIGGLVALGLLLLGGTRDPVALVAGYVLCTLLVGLAITAVVGPLWLVMHVAGLRLMRHAMSVAAGTALALCIGAQTYGFGLFNVPVIDSRTWIYRWISATLTSLLIAILAALVGAVMWRVAYRRERAE